MKFSRDKTSIPKGMKELYPEGLRADAVGKANRLLVEVASWTGFTQHFTHLKTGEPAKDLEPILAAILADGINLGPFKMANTSADC